VSYYRPVSSPASTIGEPGSSSRVDFVTNKMHFLSLSSVDVSLKDQVLIQMQVLLFFAKHNPQLVQKAEPDRGPVLQGAQNVLKELGREV
jgi:hypothetical protein